MSKKVTSEDLYKKHTRESEQHMRRTNDLLEEGRRHYDARKQAEWDKMSRTDRIRKNQRMKNEGYGKAMGREKNEREDAAWRYVTSENDHNRATLEKAFNEKQKKTESKSERQTKSSIKNSRVMKGR